MLDAKKTKYFTRVITQSYLSVTKDVRLNSAHYLIMKINNKKELKSIVFNHSADNDNKDFMKIYRERTKEPYYFFIEHYQQVIP